MNFFRTSLFVFASIFGSLSFGADCAALKNPIRVGTTSLVEKGLVLKNATFDQTPKFDQSETFDPKVDKLDVPLFNLRYGSTPVGYLGGRIAVSGRLLSAGFPDAYIGNFNVQGSTDNNLTGGVVTYVTSKTDKGENGAKDQITSLKVVVSQGSVTSLQLTFPVMKTTTKDKTVFATFTGENQTVCLVSAD